MNSLSPTFAPDPILLVEDDEELAEEVISEFAHLAHRVVHVRDGNEGLKQALSGIYSLVLLDIQLPGMNGFDLCRKLRQTEPLLPVLIFTARSNEVDRVLGFELGADDYVTKPFSMKELVARVRRKLENFSAVRLAVQSRISDTRQQRISIGELTLDLQRRKLFRNNIHVEISAKEFDFLFLLMSHPGQAFSREELLHEIWGVKALGYEEAVVSCVYRIRFKIEADSNKPIYLLTIRGVGYAFAEPGDFSSLPAK